MKPLKMPVHALKASFISFSLVSLGIVSAFSAFAEPKTWYLDSSISYNNSTWHGQKDPNPMTNAYCWTSLDKSERAGELGAPIPVGDHYYLTDTKASPSNGGIFREKRNSAINYDLASFHIGDLSRGYGGGWLDYERPSRTCTGKVYLEKGFIIENYGEKKTYEIGFNCVLKAPESSPFVIAASYQNVVLRFTGSFEGDVGTAMKVGGNNTYYKTITDLKGIVAFEGDLSGFYGKMLLLNDDKTLLPTATSAPNSYRFHRANTLPGTIETADRVRIALNAATDSLTVGTLKFGTDCALVLPLTDEDEYASVTVTNEFSQTGPLTVFVTGTVPPHDDGGTAVYRFLTVPLTSALSWDNITLDLEDGGNIETSRLIVTNEVDGTHSLAYAVKMVEIEDYVYQTVTDSSSRDSKDTESSWTNALHWSDEELPHSGATYYVKRRDGVATCFRTIFDTTNNSTTGMIEFPGDALYVGAGCTLAVQTHNIQFKKLVMLPSTILLAPCSGRTPNAIPTIWGPMEVRAGHEGTETVTFRTYVSKSLKIAGPLSGDGRIRMEGNAPTSSPLGYYYLQAENEDFTGTLLVTQIANMKNPDYFTTNQTLFVRNELNLGGCRPAFDPKALTLERCGTLKLYSVTDTLELSTNYNRGVYVNGRGRLTTEPEFNSKGKLTSANNLRLSTRLTLNGELRKAGTGVLTLAGNGACESPSSVDLAEGTLNLECAGALDGADIAMAEGTQLGLKLDLADETIGDRGFRLGAITFPEGAETLPVALTAAAVPEAFAKTDISVAVLTAPTDTATALFNGLEIRSRLFRGHELKAKTLRDNGDGTSTIVTEFEPAGLSLIIK